MTERNLLVMWTIYREADDRFVARDWIVGAGPDPVQGEQAIISRNLAGIREILDSRGLYALPRSPMDDPSIVETWV